jgi:hypothetical protein
MDGMTVVGGWQLLVLGLLSVVLLNALKNVRGMDAPVLTVP